MRSIRSAVNNTIIFYDLGLKEIHVEELKSVCNLEVRKFDFHAYPDFVSRIMGGYHFKPIIMAEVFSEFEHFWIVDTSIRFFNVTPFLFDFYNNVTSSTFETVVLRRPTGHSIFAATHPSMYEYLPIDSALAKELEMLEYPIFIARSEVAREAIKWNALCALTKECMAPSGAVLSCSFGDDRFNAWAKCHRYDQSSINIVLSTLLERDGWKRRDRNNDNSMRSFTAVKR
ncbi:hypothetical protein PMAYCL1PPCAC_33107, partial [Pristionchus mayeri]